MANNKEVWRHSTSFSVVPPIPLKSLEKEGGQRSPEWAIGWPAEREESVTPVKVTDLSETTSLSWEQRGQVSNFSSLNLHLSPWHPQESYLNNRLKKTAGQMLTFMLMLILFSFFLSCKNAAHAFYTTTVTVIDIVMFYLNYMTFFFFF